MQFSPRKYRSRDPEYFAQSLGVYIAALRRGDGDAAARVIDELPVQAMSLEEIYLKLIVPALSAIGDAWCAGEIGVGQEHLATQIVLLQLDRLRATFAAQARPSSYHVLVSCAQGEQHFIGARMFADLCLGQGWTVDFLGPDLPTRDLLEMVKSRRPQLLALSVTMAPGLEAAQCLLQELAQVSSAPKVILGGQAMAAGNGWVRAFGECAVACDLTEGISMAARLHRAERPKTILKEYLIGLGRRVRQLRTERGWTQEQLAQASRVTRVCIVAVEGGKQNVSMDIVVRMANALGIRPQGLLTGEDDLLGSRGRQV